MYPAAFDYHAPKNVKEALGLLGKLKDDAKILAGGHSLIPMMKLRLAQPKHLIDLGKVPGLSGIKADGKALVIGAMTTHCEVEAPRARGGRERHRRPGSAEQGDDRRLTGSRRPGRRLAGGDDRARRRDGLRGAEGQAQGRRGTMVPRAHGDGAQGAGDPRPGPRAAAPRRLGRRIHEVPTSRSEER